MKLLMVLPCCRNSCGSSGFSDYFHVREWLTSVPMRGQISNNISNFSQIPSLHNVVTKGRVIEAEGIKDTNIYFCPNFISLIFFWLLICERNRKQLNLYIDGSYCSLASIRFALKDSIQVNWVSILWSSAWSLRNIVLPSCMRSDVHTNSSLNMKYV